MTNKFLRYFVAVCGVFQLVLGTAAHAWAQVPGGPEVPAMADDLRASGKIYVVVAAVVIIIAGLLVYLIALDRKVSRLEKRAAVEGGFNR
ncbi:CcmD family protein [Hymenobacter nivis]|uniref:CcmD family protein n=1 Tax=Hymenobacter nivis TaxID=1850093 RepID=A0A2Z3H109_9BACT|nr:CcmD family protein [Hymenobacter nivis]AWM34680.1 CcmD family protein [Hymenobacter nivis]